MVVVEWSLTRLADSLQCGKMNDIVDVGVLRKDLVQLLLIGDVAVVVFRALAGDELYAVEDFVGGVVKVVDDDDLVVCFEERERGEGANVARATGRNCLAVAPRVWSNV